MAAALRENGTATDVKVFDSVHPTVLVDDAVTRIGRHARRPHMMPEPFGRNFKMCIKYEWRQLHAGEIKSRHFLGRFNRK